MSIKLVAQDEFGKKFLIDQSTDGSANIILTNVDCLGSVYEGAAVRMDNGTAVNAIADSMINSNVIGLVENKLSTNKCNIRVTGVTEGAIFSSLDETKEYFLSDSIDGGVSTTPPIASGSILLIIGQPFSSTTMLVNKGSRTVRS